MAARWHGSGAGLLESLIGGGRSRREASRQKCSSLSVPAQQSWQQEGYPTQVRSNDHLVSEVALLRVARDNTKSFSQLQLHIWSPKSLNFDSTVLYPFFRHHPRVLALCQVESIKGDIHLFLRTIDTIKLHDGRYCGVIKIHNPRLVLLKAQFVSSLFQQTLRPYRETAAITANIDIVRIRYVTFYVHGE